MSDINLIRISTNSGVRDFPRHFVPQTENFYSLAGNHQARALGDKDSLFFGFHVSTFGSVFVPSLSDLFGLFALQISESGYGGEMNSLSFSNFRQADNEAFTQLWRLFSLSTFSGQTTWKRIEYLFIIISLFSWRTYRFLFSTTCRILLA